MINARGSGEAGLLSRRFAAQGLSHRSRETVTELAGRLAGLQAQDTGALRLSVRARVTGLTAEQVRAECAEPGALVRTWLMRGTLHLVPAVDVRWMLDLFGARNVAANAGRRKQLGLDEKTCRKAMAALPEILDGGAALSRADLVKELLDRKVPIDPSGQAPAHLMAYAAGHGLICRGPDLDRDEPGYVLLDAWAPAAREVDDPVAELARRYAAAYGPADAQDFASWSGLPLSTAKAAFPQIAKVARGQSGSPVVRLLGAYDTYLLGYRDRTPALDAAYAKRIQAGGGVIHPSVCVDGRIAGRWRLERKRAARVVVEPFGSTLDGLREQLQAEAADVGRFLGEPVTLAG